MRCFNVGLGDGEIAAHHVERGVAENPLQRVDIPVVSQKLNRERVAEPVGRNKLPIDI